MIASIQIGPALPEGEREYWLSPHVIFVTVEDGSARLLDMAGSFHALPAVGTRMLQETLARGSEAAITRIAREYGVAPQQVRNDLAVFLLDLETQGLLCRQGSRPRSDHSALGLARFLLRPSLNAAHRFLRLPKTKSRALLTLARVSFALFGWTRTITVWREAHAYLPVRQSCEADAETVQALDAAVHAAAASHPVAVACKERALCSWSLARAAGLNASVVVGIAVFPVAGHCWCEVGTQTLGDNEEWCCRFTPVARW
jgi:hypothetical protein